MVHNEAIDDIQSGIHLLWWYGSDLWRCWRMDYWEYVFMRTFLHIRYVDGQFPRSNTDNCYRHILHSSRRIIHAIFCYGNPFLIDR